MSKQEVYAAQSAHDSALATYEAFRAQHADILEEHDHLAVLLTAAIEALKDALRMNHTLFGKTFGGYKIAAPREYNAEELRSILGPKADPYLKVKYSIDSKAFENAVANGQIDRSVADKVTTTGTPRVSGGPKPPTIFER